MTAAPIASVELLRVACVRASDEPRERIGSVGHGDEMHVLWQRDVDFDPFYGVGDVPEAVPQAA